MVILQKLLPSSSCTLNWKYSKENPNPIHVPCHIIVKSNGKLGGYMYGMSMKKELLKKEGIKFQDDDNLRDFNICRMDFKKEIWMDTNET